MPFTFNGCGTKYYGKRDVAEDGSFVTTLWVCFLWVPFIPLKSYRILATGKGFNALVVANQQYIAAPVPLQLSQIRNVLLGASPFIIGLIWYAIYDHVKEKRERAASAAAMLAPIAAPNDESAADLRTACGAVLKLNKDTMERLNVNAKMQALGARLTAEDKRVLGDAWDKDAFSGYAAGYGTWQRSPDAAQAVINNALKDMATRAIKDEDGKDEQYRAAVERYVMQEKDLIERGFSIGRNDARTSPCLS